MGSVSNPINVNSENS